MDDDTKGYGLYVDIVLVGRIKEMSQIHFRNAVK